MNISQKCNCCSHEKVCSFCKEYNSICEKIVSLCKSEDVNTVEVSIKCKHFNSLSSSTTNFR